MNEYTSTLVHRLISKRTLILANKDVSIQNGILEMSLDVEAAVADLLSDDDKLFVQLWSEEYTNREIGEKLGKTEKAIVKKKKRVAVKLADYLNV
ncbi:hypothetical protein ABEX78_32195 [Priestia megaterium]